MQEKETQIEEFSFKKIFIPLTNLKAIHWIIFIGIIVYSNGLINGFISDDIPQIVQNYTVHSLMNFSLFFTGSTFFNGSTQQLAGIYYRPLVDLINSIIYSLLGPNAIAFHLFSLLLHIINACLVFLVFTYFFKKPIAFVLSVIFLVHPINSEVVYYISDTEDVLFFFFGILALLILQNYNTQKAYIIASLLLLFSLFAKETGIVFILIAVFFNLLFKNKNKQNGVALLLSPLILYIPLRLHAIGLSGNLVNSSNIANTSFYIRLINIPAMFFYYIKTFIFPLNLALFYQWVYTKITFSHFYLPLFIDICFLTAIFYLGYVVYKKYNHKLFKTLLLFLLCFLCGIALHMQIFLPLDATVAERWFYLPSIGLLGIFGVLFEVFRINTKNKAVIIILICIITLLSIRSFERSFDWRNIYTLATHDIAVSKAWNLENLLSNAYQQQGLYEQAKIHAERSISLYPTMDNYLNLGAVDVDLGDYKGAKTAYLKSIQVGQYYQTYENLGFLDEVYGNPKDNINFLKNDALKKFPQDGQLWQSLAVIEYKQGDKSDAEKDIKIAYYYDPNPQTLNFYNAIMNDYLNKIKIKII
jgi:tetratricopeptide (TPR) repeat protein